MGLFMTGMVFDFDVRKRELAVTVTVSANANAYSSHDFSLFFFMLFYHNKYFINPLALTLY